MARIPPDFTRETALIAEGCPIVIGVDEVGRGPLAGPVTAAAVWLDAQNIPPGLADSKALTAARRAQLYDQILAVARVGVGHASVDEIDRVNILQATYLAMARAVAALPLTPHHALIDGNRIPPGLPCPATAVVKGDALSLSIAAASIVAKVTRDRIMCDLDQAHPGYGWRDNAGYPTPAHLRALQDMGVTPHHRRSFAPVHNILYQEHSITR